MSENEFTAKEGGVAGPIIIYGDHNQVGGTYLPLEKQTPVDIPSQEPSFPDHFVEHFPELLKQARLLKIPINRIDVFEMALEHSPVITKAKEKLELEFQEQKRKAKERQEQKHKDKKILAQHGKSKRLKEQKRKIRSAQEKEQLLQRLSKGKLPEEINEVRQRYLQKNDKITLFANDIGLPYQTIQQFFSAEPIEHKAFMKICTHLNLEWQKVLDSDFLRLLTMVIPKVKAQHYLKVQSQCGSLKILDVARPVELDSIFVDVNILEEPPSYQQLEIADLPKIYNPKEDSFDRLGLGRVLQRKVPGLKALADYSKLMVLGKPGSGKTTFLKYVAVRCNQDLFEKDSIPVFISLKDFVEDVRSTGNYNLLNYITLQLCAYEYADKLIVSKLLSFGRVLILLDGLDEVSESESDSVVRQIHSFSEEFYRNHFVITCRTASYGYRFGGFTEVEIADFTPKQVESFANKWFRVVDKNSIPQANIKAKKFVETLNRPENLQIKEIANTPILLNLCCLVFQARADFPNNRAKLYDQGIDILLRKWDKEKRVKRDEVYKNLSIGQRIEILNAVALTTFEYNRYFFDKIELQSIISEYIGSPNSSQAGEVDLLMDSEAVIQAIETQHGLLVERAKNIYSFSHLTFQEYFTARALIHSFKREGLDQKFSHITKKSWREVFLLAASMIRDADDLLEQMKLKIDGIIASEPYLQELLEKVEEKSLSVKSSYKAGVVRAFYFDFALNFNPNDISLHAIHWLKAQELDLPTDMALDLAIFPKLAKHCKLACSLSPELSKALKPMQSIDFNQVKSSFTQNKIDKFRNNMIRNRNIGHHWKFSSEQKTLLQQYYYANKLLVDCMNSGCTVSSKVREKIETNLLIPSNLKKGKIIAKQRKSVSRGCGQK